MAFFSRLPKSYSWQIDSYVSDNFFSGKLADTVRPELVNVHVIKVLSRRFCSPTAFILDPPQLPVVCFNNSIIAPVPNSTFYR